LEYRLGHHLASLLQTVKADDPEQISSGFVMLCSFFG
jgi:hypothetical protein